MLLRHRQFGPLGGAAAAAALGEATCLGRTSTTRSDVRGNSSTEPTTVIRPSTSSARASSLPRSAARVSPGGDPVQRGGRGVLAALHDGHGRSRGRERLGDTGAHPAAADHAHDGGCGRGACRGRVHALLLFLQEASHPLPLVLSFEQHGLRQVVGDRMGTRRVDHELGQAQGRGRGAGHPVQQRVRLVEEPVQPVRHR